MFSFSLMKHIPKGVLSSQPELCFPIKCACLHLGRPVGAPKSSWQMSWISDDAEFCCFLFSCIQCQPSGLYWPLSVNQLMPRHEADEELRPRLLQEQDGCASVVQAISVWQVVFLSVAGSTYPWRVFTILCCLLYTQCTLLSVKGEVSLWLCN